MSFNLWRFFIEDDVENFRHYLARAIFERGSARNNSGANGHSSFKIGSPGALGSSPKSSPRSRKPVTIHTNGRGNGPVLSRADINARDAFGRTLLHHAASSPTSKALDFVKILLEVPFLDLYIQDAESGWTALHRALYVGNTAIAQALMVRDIQNATDYTTSASFMNAGGLIKIKDHEGNSPFELFGLTIAPRILQKGTTPTIDADDVESTNSLDFNEDNNGEKTRRHVQPSIDLQGDEVFAFGSNKNFTLGLGDGDDRQFPEKIHLIRPEYLLQHMHEDYIISRQGSVVNEDLLQSVASLQNSEIPARIRNKTIIVQDVVMSKLHTAVLTGDPISNLFVCGYGPGGRLGTGDEATRFDYVCIQGGGLTKRRVVSIALGQDHSVAICSSGEVFTWGNNKYGQLGYELPEVSVKEVPVQLTPRQLYGLIKKEQITGAAASSIHSAIFTKSSLYTFGKNEGQLGLMDADARSLNIQVIPRRVGVSILQSSIQSVAAIDRATTVLLENGDVVVFTHYGWTKVVFQLEGFTNYFISDTLTTRYNMETNHIRKLTAGGNTICAMSSYGEVFTIEVPHRIDTGPSNKSTTNPMKARNALPTPTKVWSIRKSHMAAIDVAVGQEGSIILCTASGGVWRKVERIKIKATQSGPVSVARAKDYKFVRVPNVTRAVAVRSNAFGAFIAVRRDCDVMREQVHELPPTLWDELFPLLVFRDYGPSDQDSEDFDAEPRFWRPMTSGPSPALIKRALLTRPDVENDFLQNMERWQSLSSSPYDIWITSNVTDVHFPVHALMLKARSRVLRKALTDFHETYYFSIRDVLSIEYGSDGQVVLQLQGADFLTLANLVMYLYSETLADFWHYTSKALHLAPRYRQIRSELMKIASTLEMKELESSVRVMVEPARSMREDFEMAFVDPEFYTDTDIVIDLADEEERYGHSVLLCARCPFFEGLFNGRTGGMWMAARRKVVDNNSEAIRVDLKHIDASIFDIVLRHIYADSGDELFDDVVTKDLDEFIDLVIEVMSVANELMLDRLGQICQKVLGGYVNTKNVCGLLNTIAESSINEFKHAALEYICLNLENMLEQRLLEELDEDLLEDLMQTVQENQLAYMPFSRSKRAQEELLDRHPQLPEMIDQSRRRRLDSVRLRSRLVEDEERLMTNPKQRVGSVEQSSSLLAIKHADGMSNSKESPIHSPAMVVAESGEEFPFDMDEDAALPASKLDQAEALNGRASEVLPNQAFPNQSFVKSSSSLQRSMEDLNLLESVDADRANLVSTPQASNNVAHSSIVAQPGSTISKLVWNTPSQKVEKLDLKDILGPNSTRVSNLTKSLQNPPKDHSTSVPKMSQKERKKRQQEAKLQEEIHESEPAKLQQRANPATSPWQTVKGFPRLEFPPAPSPGIPTTPSISPTSRPNITTRQTVSAQNPKSKQPTTVRAQSTPGIIPAVKVSPAPIQSIRHIPVTTKSSLGVDARTSMADILSQQQSEKISIKEAAAKRSLQEIQQEQEFQEWWDLESQRIQQEEQDAVAAATAAAGANTATRGKGGRGRGDTRRKGSGRSAAAHDAPEGGGRGRGRGQSGGHGSTRGSKKPHRGPGVQREDDRKRDQG